MTKTEIKKLRQLQQKKFREEERLFIAEGPKVVNELLNSEYRLKRIYSTVEFKAAERISVKELEQISALTTPNEMLAVFEIPAEEEFSFNQTELVLALEDIRDPGNFGTIIRIADWFGIKKIICSETCVDIYNPKVIQSTMGSIARVKVFYMNLEEIISKYRANVFAAVMSGKNIYEEKLSSGGIILIGNESKGISENILKNVSNKISIPRFGKAESLNAAIATAIICSEFKREMS